MENENNVEVIEIEETVEVEVEKIGTLTKLKNWAKANKKKIVAGVAIGAGAIAMYMVGRNSNKGNDDVMMIEGADPDDWDDVDWTDSDTETDTAGQETDA